MARISKKKKPMGGLLRAILLAMADGTYIPPAQPGRLPLPYNVSESGKNDVIVVWGGGGRREGEVCTYVHRQTPLVLFFLP